MFRSILCDESDACILETITVPNIGGAENPNNRKNIIIKTCVPFTDCTSEMNDTQIDHAKYIGIIIQMYKLIEYSDNYSKTSGSFWQY